MIVDISYCDHCEYMSLDGDSFRVHIGKVHELNNEIGSISVNDYEDKWSECKYETNDNI